MPTHTIPATADSILHLLHLVQQQRQQRLSTPGLEAAVTAVKAYQQLRFSQTHADLLASRRYGAASRFFLDELYGPRDFSERDTQFARVVPALVKLFPQDITNTVQTLAELHALSESLDTSMGQALSGRSLDGRAYVRAWQSTARAPEREAQIALTVRLGTALDRLTGKPLLRHSLRMMRGPARAAGLQQLHALLEGGFDTFHAMRGAREFLDTVAQRERELAAALFAVPVQDLADAKAGEDPDAFLGGLLPKAATVVA
jgi:hypothetical protein